MGVKTKFKETMYPRIHALAKAGMADSRIAETLGVSPDTFVKWKKRNPAIQEVIDQGKAEGGEQETFADYLYGRLPKRLRIIWDRILKIEEKFKKKPHKAPFERIEALLRDNGTRARQQLFLHALICSNYSLTTACRRVMVSKRTFERWVIEDPEFASLVEGIDQAKSDFFEDALIEAVKRGETSAVIFANRTYNAKRGYGNKIQVDHTHDHRHTVVPVDQLNLDLKQKKALLKALKEHRGGGDIEEAEILNVREAVQ